MRKVLVIGLDCAAPELVFERWTSRLPNIQRLLCRSLYGKLISTIPPITVPAWMSMMTSKDPGRLGLYGFRNRKDYSYNGLALATSRAIQEDTVWDISSRAGKSVTLIGVPPSYPPKPVNGHVISCFMTPNATSQYTYPPSLKAEVEKLVGEYLFDAEGFRSDDKEQLLRNIYLMTEKRFTVAKYLMRQKPWDFFMLVEMGVDRIHHGFWKYFDACHRKHQPGSPFEHAIRDYYIYLDSLIGELLALTDEQTAVLIVSDHGAKRLEGGICINEWLMAEGYLAVQETPTAITPFGRVAVNWKQTRAWGEGGYYGRLFLNVKGREPDGTIDPAEYETTRDELINRLKRITDEKGRPIGVKAFKPQQIYSECLGIPPDLIIYFGDLSWRSVGSVGYRSIWTFENDTGPDDANHAQHGIFILHDPCSSIAGREVQGARIIDIAPTLLTLLGLPIPQDMQGRSLL
jgi:predicted AlkP superfamily phosphohydrolase/phosphomutase